MDQAEILKSDASTVRQLVDAGFDPDAVIDAVKAGDLSRLLGAHSGLYSVQLQPPADMSEPDADETTEPDVEDPAEPDDSEDDPTVA
jgi:hypothetical protein